MFLSYGDFEMDKKKKNERESKFQEARDAIAKNIITKEAPTCEWNISEYYYLSMMTLVGYSTLDWKHSNEILELIKNIKKYAQDKTRNRPLNIMLQAKPGFGKSHFIKCLSNVLSAYDVQEVIFNMTTIESIENFIRPLDLVRNLKINDKLPLLFLDEFDCNEERYPILLPLLWDGEIQVGYRNLKVGKVIIVLAGSKGNLEDEMKKSRSMQKEMANNSGKIRDLFSRINGGLFVIPEFEIEKAGRNRKVDKVCITIALLKQRFKGKLELISWPLLSFISQIELRYGVRSIAYIIDCIPEFAPKAKRLKTTDLNLPLDKIGTLKKSTLASHIIANDGVDQVVELWQTLRKHDGLIKVK